ncbi:MAG: cell division protein FtsZ [Candidatus Pacebacteria bacterium]|nr:cell division protein FtsZ [Candidatus Paceibacterota bacterium]
MPKVNPSIESFARIKVIGIGGSGKNALNHMISEKVRGVEFICMNTDTQDLHNSLADKKIHLGKNLTKGLGAGMNPEVGKKAAEETRSEIQDVIRGAEMVFISCGMGGGTGTGAAAVVARAAREEGVLTVAVVTKPFVFEGRERMRIAETGLQELEHEVDAIIVIPNDRLLTISSKETSLKNAFAMCDEVLRQAVEGISDLITIPGDINVDFNDIKTIMQDAGTALMGIGLAQGEKRAEKAAFDAINSPLLEVSINGAKGILLAISGGEDLTLHEVAEAAKIVTESTDKEAKVIFGTSRDDRLKKGEMKVTVIATGFPGSVPRKSLFESTPQTIKETEQTADIPIRTNTESTKPQIHNSFDANDTQNQISSKPKQIPEVIEDDSLSGSDDMDDWSAVPAFLRRKK